MRSPWYLRAFALVEAISELRSRCRSENRRHNRVARLGLQELESRINPGLVLTPADQWIEAGGTANFGLEWAVDDLWYFYTYWNLTLNFGDNHTQGWEVGPTGGVGASHTDYANAIDYRAHGWINVRHQGDPFFSEIDSNDGWVHAMAPPSPSMPTPATGGPAGGGKAPCNCSDPVSDLPAFVPNESSDAPIRYNDGVINYRMVDLSSSGFGSTWTQSRSWTNDSTYSGDSINGVGTVDAQMPHLVDLGGGSVGVVSDGTTTRYFDAGSRRVPGRQQTGSRTAMTATATRCTVTTSSTPHSGSCITPTDRRTATTN